MSLHPPTKRGCRGGDYKQQQQQQQINPIIGNIPATHFLGQQAGPNFSNLQECATKRSKLCTMTMCLINAQSVRNKVTPLSDYIIEHGFDIVAFTETWLRNTPDDDQIIRAMTIPGYKFTHVPRRQHKNTTARGGGIAILHKSNTKMASKSSWKTNSFENMEVTLSASSTVKLAVIYRPPPSKRNKSTIGLFLSEFQDFLQHHVVKSQNTLILGDFNFHYEDQLNTDASRFRDILSNHSLSASTCRDPLIWMGIR